MEDLYRLQDLFQKGLASPKDRDEYGWTALHHAGLFPSFMFLLTEFGRSKSILFEEGIFEVRRYRGTYESPLGSFFLPLLRRY
jgi:hypothetical protein